MPRRKLLLIFNPKSGKGEFPQKLFEVVDGLTKNDFEVTVHPTQEAKDCYRYIIQRAEDFDYLVCSGGDGTFNEALDALMPLKRRPVFGYIPSGTANDFAGSLGIPKDTTEAADVIINGEKRAIDVGLFGSEDYYSYVAAFGLFTDVAYATPQDLKNMLGHAAYMMEGVKRLASIKAYDCVVELENEKISGQFILGLLTNTASLGGFSLPEDGSTVLDDGLFELTLVRRPKTFAELSKTVAELVGAGGESNGIIRRRVQLARFISGQDIDWTRDGEFGGTTRDVTLRCMHKALEILVPINRPAGVAKLTE